MGEKKPEAEASGFFYATKKVGRKESWQTSDGSWQSK